MPVETLASSLPEHRNLQSLPYISPGKPYLELIPYHGEPRQRKPGRLKGKIKIAPDFDTTPDKIIQAVHNNEE